MKRLAVMVGIVLGLAGCKRTTAATFELLQEKACEDKISDSLELFDQKRLEQNSRGQASAKSGDAVALVGAVISMTFEKITDDLKQGKTSAFCDAKHIKVDEKARKVTWVTSAGARKYARFEEVDGKLKIVEMGDLPPAAH